MSLQQLRAWLLLALSHQEISDMDNNTPAFWTQVLDINQTLEHKKPLGRQTSLSLVCGEKSEQRLHMLSLIYSFINLSIEHPKCARHCAGYNSE